MVASDGLYWKASPAAGGTEGTGVLPSVLERNVAPSRIGHFGNVVRPPATGNASENGEAIALTAAIWASDRHASPVSAPPPQRSVVRTVSIVKTLLHSGTLLMMPSLIPSSPSHAA